MDPSILVWTAAGFVLGAIPFSVLITERISGQDPRSFGDRNPGAVNAWRAAGWRAGIPSMLLDFFKGAIPVGLAHYRFGVTGIGLIPVALAPVVGHAFSPFLRFRGGKALAVTFGVWAGLTLGEAALILGLFFGLFYLTIRPEAWAVVLGMLGLLVHLVLRGIAPALFVIWTGNAAILLWKYREELRRPPSPRPDLLAGISSRLRQ